MHTSKNINARKSTTPSLRPRICSAMILAAGLTTQVYGAAISYTTAGGTYSQNFDTLPTTLTGGTQLSNTTAGSVYELTGTLNSVPAGVSGSFGTGTEGWFFSRIAAESGTTNYAPIVRTSTTFPTPASYGSVYSLSDSTLNPGDKALGMAGATSALHAIGAEFTNTTGSTLNKFTISFDMEEWRKGSSGVNTMTFGYSIGGTNIRTGTFTGATALNMVSISPLLTPDLNFFDGNLAPNRIAGVTATISGLTWNNGQKLVIRWQDANESGTDDVLAIDNFSFSANVTAPYVWNSGSFSGAQAWDTIVGAPQQWLSPGASDFVNGETAEFSQNNGATVNITVAAGVTPAATVISSNTDTYTFGGAAIGGGTLTKSGAGTAVFNAANSFSGVSVGGGLVQATVANAVGSAAPISLTGGTLESQLTGALGTGAISFNGGTLKATTAATQTYANAWSIGASGGIIDVAGGTTLTMSTNVTATTSTLTKNGTGTLVISGAFGSNYTGSSLVINDGTIRVAGTGNSLASATIIDLVSATSVFDDSPGDGENMGGFTGLGTFIEKDSPTAAPLFLSNGVNLSFSFAGKITGGSGGVIGTSPVGDDRRFNLTKGGTGTITLSGGTSDFAGQTIIQGGTLSISTLTNRGVASSIGFGTTHTTPGTNVAAPGSTDIVIGSAAVATTLEYTGGNTASDRAIALASTGAVAIGVTNAAAKLTLNGIISSTATPSSFTKTGPGTLELTNANTYAGPTIVADGTLLADNTSGSATDGGNVTVNAAGTLGGTGIITGSVTVDGKLSPGSSIESLATGTVALQTGSTLVYEASPVDANIADLLDITGNLNLTGSVALDLAGADLANPAWGLVTISIASYTGTWNGGTFATWLDDTAQAFGGNLWTINYNDIAAGINFTSEQAGAAGYVTLTQTVPEPSALLSLLGGSALLLARRRRLS